ncbi:MAG: retention module-containing protein, partial [Gallionellaceae bacterium]|nr:retention module-containing protein [Gallionellaceae bacterium]
MATNSIPSAVATVSAVKGTVYVRDASGTPHRLQAGDVVTAGDVVITAADGHVEFSFDNGAVLALDEGIHKIGTPAGSDSTERPDGTDAAAVDKIIQAIEQGQPIDDLLEETAAGLGAGGTDEGHGFVRLGRITEGVTTVAYQEPLASAPAPLSELAQPSVMLAPEPPQAPVAVDDLIGGLEDQALTITAAQLFGADGTGPDNDRDGDSAAFASITVVSLPAHGVMQLDGQPVAAGQTIAVADIEAGRLTFVPDPDWHGSTSFDYAVSDGSQTSNTATVTLAIASVNDAPVAVDNTVTVPEDTVMHGNVITDDDNGSAPGGVDYDVDGDPLSVTGFTVAGDPTIHNPGDTVTIAGIGTFQLNADGSYTFAPAPDYDGPVPAITYTINDGQGGQDSATLTINMAGGDDTPVAGDDHAVTNEDTPITIPVLANDSDVDGDPISIVKINGSAVQVGAPVAVDHGTVTLNADGTLTFSPAPDYYGDTSFNYTITDGITEVPATVYVTVNPVNDPPVANDDVASTPINTGIDIDVKANDSDPDNSRDDLTVSSAVLSDPSQGTLTINPDGSLHFVPAQNFTGEVEITYTLTDPEGLSDSATVTVNVGANTLPEGADITRSTPEDTAYVVQKADFGFSDPDAGQ